MADDLVQKIKTMASGVAVSFLTANEDMNHSIIDLWNAGEIENEEILKRVCELANSNVYLALFNDPAVNKGNIQFKLADYQSIHEQIQQSEDSMNEFKTPPEDFKSLLEQSIETDIPQEKTASDNEYDHIDAVHQLNDLLGRVRSFASTVGMLKTSELKTVENTFNKIAHETKLMVAKGDSLGDIAKIAARSVGEIGGDMMKVAKIYDVIQKDLVENGFNVRTEFTKLSSLKVNPRSKVLQPVHELVMSIEKAAAFAEMEENAKAVEKEFSSMLTKVLGNGKSDN